MKEMNKDESLRCLEIAQQAFRDGNLQKSEKFAHKSHHLYPSDSAEALLNRIKETRRNQENTGDSKSSSQHASMNGNGAGKSFNGSGDGVRNRRNSDGRRTENIDYTSEQLEAVKNVKKCKNYYEILGVTKTATDSEIKKAYKKLALLLHPDKNRAPGASEAFKAVGNAAAILTDTEKRKQYDLYGINQPLSNGQPASGNGTAGGGMRGNNFYTSEFGYANGFQADVSAEELFNIFFGGGFPQQSMYMRSQRRRHQREERGENQHTSSTLISILPIFFLIGLSMLSSFFITDPIYSLAPSHKYNVKRETTSLKIPYYVKEDFYSEYEGSVSRLEESVEEDYLNHLKQSCGRERNYRESMLAKARAFGDRDLFRKAQNINLPSCETLQKYLNT